MKRIMMTAIAIFLMTFATTAMAADTNTLTVQASVAGTCKFSPVGGTSTLDFATLDPSNPVPVTVSTTTQFWCTKGVVTDSITANNGSNYTGTSRAMAGPGGDIIPYQLTLTPDSNTNSGPTAPRTLTIDGDVLASDYVSVSAGSYSDTVTLNINP